MIDITGTLKCTNEAQEQIWKHDGLSYRLPEVGLTYPFYIPGKLIRTLPVSKIIERTDNKIIFKTKDYTYELCYTRDSGGSNI